MSEQNQQASASAKHEQSTWAELYQHPEDLEMARIVVETLNADQNLLRQHPALYIRAMRTLRQHEASVRRWKVVVRILRGSGRLALAFLKRVASMIAAGYTALIDANTKQGERPDLQELVKDPVLRQAFEEFLQQRNNGSAAEQKEAKAA